jgi:5-deoxy-glucuronate isomerase
MRRVVSRGRDSELIDVSVAELAPGESLDLDAADPARGGEDGELMAVVLSGRVSAEVDGTPLGTAGGRRDVFEQAGHGVYAPPGAGLSLAAEEPATVVVATAPVDGGRPGEARIVAPEDQRIATPGAGNWSRTVRTMLGPEHPAGRLMVGETINPPGNWSSYPPHKHDRHAPPDEVRLEEIYLFKLDPAHGFGIQLRYDPERGREEVFRVHDGDVAVIGSGYHPVVAAPGYQLYYLWVLAGEAREMALHFDPEHAWVQEAPTAEPGAGS